MPLGLASSCNLYYRTARVSSGFPKTMISKRSSGDPYLPSKSVRKLVEEGNGSRRKLKISVSSELRITTQEPSVPENVDVDEELSNDIALAVATIVAENELLHNEEEENEESDYDYEDPPIVQKYTRRPSTSSLPKKKSHDSGPKGEGDSTCSIETSDTTSTTKSKSRFGPAPSPSRAARMGTTVELLRYLGRVQNYMNHLGYQREGEPEIRINSRLSMKMQMITAKEIIRAGAPIKCLHAVVLAVSFTNCVDSVERFPIYFRSHIMGKEYKHIVLGIYVQGHFGALGISRDTGLQDKKTVYTKLSDLVFEFADCYGQSGHILHEIKFGNIITHDPHSLEKLFSKIGTISMHGASRAEIESNVERFAKQLRAKMGLPCLKALRLDAHHSPAPLVRNSRSKTSLAGNVNFIRTRTLSIEPATLSRIRSEESVKRGTRSRPPKAKRK